MWGPEARQTVLDRIASGESLRSICRSDGMPGFQTVLDWLDKDEGFRAKYARAREVQAEVLVDEMQDIADNGANDWMERHDSGGESSGWRLNGEAVARSKLRLEQRRWFAEKLLPKKYGQKIDLNHAGEVRITKIERVVLGDAPSQDT